MNLKKLENEVKINSILFEGKLSTYLKTNKDEYAVFNQGDIFFVNTFKEGVTLGIDKFGEKTGFVVKKVSKEMPILSALVTL